METTSATPKTKLVADFCDLFACTPDRVGGILIALGFKEPCSRCGGSGNYSWCAMYGTVCFGCKGTKFKAAKATKKVLEAARVLVEAGALEALRQKARDRKAAKASIAGLVAAAKEIYLAIGNEYTAFSMSGVPSAEVVESPLYRAQHLNNAIYFDCICQIQRNVNSGSNVNLAVSDIQEATRLLEVLRSGWLAFKAGEK